MTDIFGINLGRPSSCSGPIMADAAAAAADDDDDDDDDDVLSFIPRAAIIALPTEDNLSRRGKKL